MDVFFGAEMEATLFRKMPACFCQISCKVPAERDKFVVDFFILKPLVALVPTSCAGIFTLETVWLLFMSSVCRSPSRHFC